MKRKFLSVFLVLVLVLSLTACLFGCNRDEDNENDDDYTLTLSGLVDENGTLLNDVSVTKSQIKLLYAQEGKSVVYTDAQPCYASDKQDENGDLIPHSLKGVYLEDIMAEYTRSAGIEVYGSMTLNATDSYVTVATEETFNSSGRGSKMIVAFEYDNIVLKPSKKSGALRAVFPNQIANCWAKKLNKIEFSTELLQTPAVTYFNVIESLDSKYRKSFEGITQINGQDVACTYFGYKISDLITDKVLNAQSSDKMNCSAWDYNSDTDKYNEYSVWTKYDVYNAGYLLYEKQPAGGALEDMTRVPVFDGPNPPFSAGMTVKNVLALSVFNSAVVSFETAFTKFDKANAGEFLIKDLIMQLRMYDKDYSYVVTSTTGVKTEISVDKLMKAKVVKENGDYVLVYQDGRTTIKSIAVKL